MGTENEQPTIVRKEMGITHKDFYDELPGLLQDVPYQQGENRIRFQIDGKKIDIELGPEGCRQLGPSVQLPVTPVTIRFFGFSDDDIGVFLKRFNLRFMKGGG